MMGIWVTGKSCLLRMPKFWTKFIAMVCYLLLLTSDPCAVSGAFTHLDHFDFHINFILPKKV
jgi:hypothetical protein